ncbi:hypothetical protein B0T26DRAFT_482977 [Lasiosphaeria miniovina]|uniref:Uncharacterized protein n=1 Tax=Lasiosphaeria miniovina TaxID=1954250 RepID=A0AA40DMV7_9PEZI|nr:uncharacterized protein B0T26DRAFT_482977 [Lasiosphaeria miniovina]KAK0707031.1 hypothetical protein B0T26DRAFT_482977 [Lasiosphaeria miniovina]
MHLFSLSVVAILLAAPRALADSSSATLTSSLPVPAYNCTAGNAPLIGRQICLPEVVRSLHVRLHSSQTCELQAVGEGS